MTEEQIVRYSEELAQKLFAHPFYQAAKSIYGYMSYNQEVRTMDSAVLFPEYIARTVRQGMEENDILPAITATTTVIDAMDYRSIYSNPTGADKELKEVAEGAAIPETEVKTKEHLVSLTKRGRMLVASYEALRFQKLDLFSVMLRQIGAHIQKQQLSDAVNVLISGDGNDNAAAIALSRRILREGEPAVRDYLEFLSGGCSKDPISLLRGAGVDMATTQPITEALQLFDELIDEMEQLLA